MRFFGSAPRAVFALAVSLGLALACLPALAQDAPPYEGEGPRRPAPAAKAPVAKVTPAKAAPAVAKKAAPARPGAKVSVKPGAKPGAKVDTKPPLRSLDKNHDGRVTKDEFLAGSKKRFAKADANKDGVISAQEAKAAKAALKEKQAKRDAKRLAEGKPVKRAKPGAKSGAKSGGKAGKPYLSALDANKDGRVSQKEYLARREKQFSKMDANRDGSVSRDEARQAKAQAKALREEKKAQAKARRLRKIEEAKAKAGMSSPGPEFVGTATPPPPPLTLPPATTPAPEPGPAMDLPLTPIAPTVPAQGAPET